MGVLWCRAGTLYGELARFILRLLGWNRPKHLITEQQQPEYPPGVPGALPGQAGAHPGLVEAAPHFQPRRQAGAVQLSSGQQALAAAWPSSSAAATAPASTQPGVLDGAWGGR